MGCVWRVLVLRFILFSSFLHLYAAVRTRQTGLLSVTAGALGGLLSTGDVNNRLDYDTIRDSILTCNQKLTWVSLIHRTEPTTKKWKRDMLRSIGKQSGESVGWLALKKNRKATVGRICRKRKVLSHLRAGHWAARRFSCNEQYHFNMSVNLSMNSDIRQQRSCIQFKQRTGRRRRRPGPPPPLQAYAVALQLNS